MDMDQIELDAAYDQTVYAPLIGQIQKRYATNSNEARAHLGAPKRLAYGPTLVEALDLYPAKKPNAPIFVFIHGGAWLRGEGQLRGQTLISTSATKPWAATTGWSTGCAPGASTRNVQVPGPAKNRKCPVADVGTSAVNSPLLSSSRT